MSNNYTYVRTIVYKYRTMFRNDTFALKQKLTRLYIAHKFLVQILY